VGRKKVIKGHLDILWGNGKVGNGRHWYRSERGEIVPMAIIGWVKKVGWDLEL